MIVSDAFSPAYASNCAKACWRQLKFELPGSLRTIRLCILMSCRMRWEGGQFLSPSRIPRRVGFSALVHATPGVTASRFAGRSANRTTPITRAMITSVKFRWTP